eukprot:PhF_6_TR23260/c0_g1_i2/m.32689/K10769/ALKBH7; alkylated DNA repair protein alkB homolog 7
MVLNTFPPDYPARVQYEFITPDEEEEMLAYLRPSLNRLTPQSNHTDHLITNYNEFYRKFTEFPPTLQPMLERCQKASLDILPKGSQLQDRVHVVQLHPEGAILPHFDNMKTSSGCVCGLTLQAGREMILSHPTDTQQPKYVMDLRPRSFYQLWGVARTTWHHSVEPLKPGVGNGKYRVSMIFRGVPASVYLFERLARKGR